jgi:hypothetical protein
MRRHSAVLSVEEHGDSGADVDGSGGARRGKHTARVRMVLMASWSTFSYGMMGNVRKEGKWVTKC